MLKLVHFDLRDPAEWVKFYNLFSAYLEEVCDDDEYREEIADLHDKTLNSQMIEQTLQVHNPYFGIVKKSAVFETPKVFLLGLRLLKPPGA